uniref:Uncharacterized protein n=1 Tax=Glossina austeni TaxID=7395 RepID=A0A1A9UDT2_GLOAU
YIYIYIYIYIYTLYIENTFKVFFLKPEAIDFFAMVDATHPVSLYRLNLSSFRNENEQVSVTARERVASLRPNLESPAIFSKPKGMVLRVDSFLRAGECLQQRLYRRMDGYA